MLDGDGAAAMPALSLPKLSFLKDPILLEDWPLDRDGKAEVFCARGVRTFVPHGVLCGLKLH
jgi:hypothetical protein